MKWKWQPIPEPVGEMPGEKVIKAEDQDLLQLTRGQVQKAGEHQPPQVKVQLAGIPEEIQETAAMAVIVNNKNW